MSHGLRQTFVQISFGPNRRRAPAKKEGLRHLLKRHKDLVSWEYDGEILCGFASWRNTRKSVFSDQPLEDLKTRLESFQSLHFADEDIQFAPVSQIVAELFYWIGGPVEIDVLVRMIVYLLDIQDEQIESLDDPSPTRWDAYFVSSTRSNESHVEANELLARLWEAVIQLAAEQRDAFALSFEDEAGQDLFTMLRAAEIVNWDHIA